MAIIDNRSGAVRNAGSVVLAHPSGNQFFRHLAVALRDADLLAEVCTCLDWRGHIPPRWLLPSGFAHELGRRSFSRELRVAVTTHPWRETARLLAGKAGLRRLTRHGAGTLSVDAVYQDFDRWLARRVARAKRGNRVYAYEDAARMTFQAAADRGWTRIYDLPIAYWQTSRRLLEEEALRWPEWEPTLLGTRDSAEKNERKCAELKLANVVVCPSRFVADSLPADLKPGTEVLIAPFGSPPPVVRPISTRPGPLRVLFAGAMTQRKGLADLFAAMRLVNRRDIQLVVMGSPVADLGFYRAQHDFVYEPPRPHADVLSLMQTCDILCLPSIVEGRALVVQEAMSVGLPVIITPNTGADDAVEAGVSGFVVPIREPAAIAEKLAWFADHRDALPAFSAAAQQSAATFTWAKYGAAIVRKIAPKLTSSPS